MATLAGSVPGSSVVRIEKLTGGGRGLSRVDGLVWLVEGAVPGDRVRATPVRRRSTLVEARTLELLEPSYLRRKPPCPFQGECGGCPWMVLEEPEQRSWKRRILEEALVRIGRFEEVRVDETVPSPSPLAYRNKLEFTFGRGGRRGAVLGFHGTGSRSLVDVDRCLLQGDLANQVLAEVRSYFTEGAGRGEPALGDPRRPLKLAIRRSGHSGRLLVGLLGAPGPFPTARPFAHQLRERVSEISGVVRLLTLPGRRGGSRTVNLAGKPWLEDTLGGTVFRLPARVFFQVNPGAAELLVRLVEELSGAGSGTRLLDLYGGVGVLGLALARRGARALVCETDGQAVACGRRASKGRKELDVRFARSDVGAFLESLAHSRGDWDVVVANPPRSGFGREVARGILALRPERIVLVSCDPATLARDARRLADGGFVLRRVVPVDMFPQTPHVEVVCVLERG